MENTEMQSLLKAEGRVQLFSPSTKMNSVKLDTGAFWYVMTIAKGKMEDLVGVGDKIRIYYYMENGPKAMKIEILERATKPVNPNPETRPVSASSVPPVFAPKQISSGSIDDYATRPVQKPTVTTKPSSKAEMINFKTLLDDAHLKGVVEIRTFPIQVDWEKKTASFKAIVTMQYFHHDENSKDKSRGQLQRDAHLSIFEGHGDASHDTITNNLIKPHWYRMAETRAIVRALRLATNNAEVAEEETQ